MAVTWGADTGGFRIGYEFRQSPATIVNGTTSATVYLDIWIWTKFNTSDSSNTLAVSGNFSFSGSVAVSTPSGTAWDTDNKKLIKTLSRSVTPSYTSTVVSSFSASLKGLDYYGSAETATTSGSHTTAKRPYATPAAPSAVTHARNSDTQNTVNWTNNATTNAPYESIKVERSVNGGAFTQVASIAGTSTSYTDTTTAYDNTYSYRVRGYNSAAYSAYSAATAVTKNTPAQPATPVATKTGATTVELAFANTSNSADATEIERRTNGGAWANIATTVGKATTYTDNAVPAGTVDYRVRNKAGALLSNYTADSNDVATATPPNPPTNLTPASGAVNGAQTIRLAWLHNPLDGSAQSAYELQYRVNGGAWVPTGKVNSANRYRDIAANTFAAGAVVEWQVRTYGVHATAGAFSAVASFTSERLPVANITSPSSDGAVVEVLPLSATWTFSDRAGLTQAGYELSVVNSAGVTVFATAANGAGTNVPLPMNLPNHGAYTLTLKVRSSSGLSSTITRAFITEYLPPLAPVVETDFDPEAGTVNIAVSAGENFTALPVGVPATATLSVYRITADGTTTTLAENIVSGSVVTDYFPPLNVDVTYRALAVSVTNTVETTDTIANANVGRRYMLNYGEGLTRVVTLLGNVSTTAKPKRDTSLYSFAGREFPVMFEGENREENLSLSAELLDEATHLALRDMVRVGGRVLYRDPDGGLAYVRAAVSFGKSPSKPTRTVNVEMDVLDGTAGR